MEKERKKGRKRNEQSSDLSFQVVAPLGSVMANGSSKCLPSVINVRCRWTHTTAHCLAVVQLCVQIEADFRHVDEEETCLEVIV